MQCIVLIFSLIIYLQVLNTQLLQLEIIFLLYITFDLAHLYFDTFCSHIVRKKSIYSCVGNEVAIVLAYLHFDISYSHYLQKWSDICHIN